MTDQQYTDWLADPTAIYTFLVELTASIGGVDTPLYLSTEPYKTSPTDVPANIVYEPFADVGTPFTEQLSLDSSDSSISAGQVSVNNMDGSYDAWFTYVWSNRPIRVLIGDVRWARSDFRTVFNGVIADIAPGGNQTIQLKLRDRMQQINTAISDALIGGAGQYKADPIPVIFGEVHNFSPVLENAATLTYRFHAGSVQSVYEVRSNGIPLDGASTPTVDLATGRFRLNKDPAGTTITATIEGDNGGGVYRRTCAALVRRIVTGFGDVTKRLSDSDIDLANFADFDSSHQQAMGIACDSRANVIDVVRQLTGSIGAQVYFTSQGVMRIVQLSLQPSGTPFVIATNDMDSTTLEPTERPDVVGAVKLNFCKNWTIQESLVGIKQEHADLYNKEWLPSAAKDDAALTLNRKSAEVTARDTMMLVQADADAECLRELNLWKTQRMVYEFDGLAQLMVLELGQTIIVYHPRYGMKNGVTGTVVSLGRNWTNRRIRVGFIV